MGECAGVAIPTWGRHPGTFLIPSIHVLDGALSHSWPWTFFLQFPPPPLPVPLVPFPKAPACSTQVLVPKNASRCIRLAQPRPACYLPHSILIPLELNGWPSVSLYAWLSEVGPASASPPCGLLSSDHVQEWPSPSTGGMVPALGPEIRTQAWVSVPSLFI